MAKKIDYNFPIFSIQGDESFSQEVQDTADIYMGIQELSLHIESLEKNLQEIGAKLNLYVNNLKDCKQPFDYLKNVIIFNEQHEMFIYDYEYLEKKILEMEDEDADKYLDMDDTENLYNDLIAKYPSSIKYSLTAKQLVTCSQFSEEYNEIYGEYEYCITKINELSEYYEDIINGIVEELSKFKPINIVYEGDYELEIFDDTKHELLLTKDKETSKWKFIYLRKEDKDKFIKLTNKTK